MTVKVIGGEGINHNGTYYGVGKTFETTDEHGQMLEKDEPHKFQCVKPVKVDKKKEE